VEEQFSDDQGRFMYSRDRPFVLFIGSFLDVCDKCSIALLQAFISLLSDKIPVSNVKVVASSWRKPSARADFWNCLADGEIETRQLNLEL